MIWVFLWGVLAVGVAGSMSYCLWLAVTYQPEDNG